MPHGRRDYVPAPSEDAHAPLASRDPRTRTPDLLSDDLDPIETACRFCVMIWSGGGWQHENSCAFRRSGPRAGRQGAA